MDAATLAAEISRTEVWVERLEEERPGLVAAIRGFVDGTDKSMESLQELNSYERVVICGVAKDNEGKDWADDLAEMLYYALGAEPLRRRLDFDQWGRGTIIRPFSKRREARHAENQARSDELVRLGKKPICIECGGTLQPIGTSRTNGRPHADWDTRKLHKKCWKLLYA